MCKALCQRQMFGIGGILGRLLPASPTDAMRCPFLPECFTAVPKGRVKEVAAMLKVIHTQEDKSAAEEKIVAVTKKLKSMKLSQAARIVEEGAKETLAKADTGDQKKNNGCRSFPGRAIRFDAGCRQTPACLCYKMGNKTISEYG